MKLSKKIMVAAAVGALGVAAAVPAMAFENEFHGMYRAYGFMTNAYSGGAAFNLAENSRTDKFIEQRARLQYIAKASDDLRLVTHFELDTKFGGSTGSKYVSGDGGNLDADRVSLETKNVYLDFKIPSIPVRATVGVQPFNDSFGGLFGNFDATGAVLAGNFGALKATYGYFTVGASATGTTFPTNNTSKDLNVLDLKFAVNKDITVGASYYNVLNKPASTIGTAAIAANANVFIIDNRPTSPTFGQLITQPAIAAVPAVYGPTLVNNTLGLNANAKFGPATITAAFGYQFGKAMAVAQNTSAIAAAVSAKVAAGPGSVNVAALYLSGDKNGTGYNKGWESIGATVNYYTPANMWLITRNAATINSSTQIGGGTDLTRNGLGLMGLFAGYEGTAGKVFYSANVGAAKVDAKRAAESANIGTELNATIGYKLYANLSTQFTAAYAFLGDGYGKDSGTLIGATATGTTAGVRNADNPFLTAIALNYAF